MRHHGTVMARRWWKMMLAGMVLSGLAVVGLPDSYAQMTYKGGFIPSRPSRPNIPAQPPAPQRTAPAGPPSLSSYFPDNDVTYPSFNPRGPTRVPADVWPYSVLVADLPWNRADFEDYNEPFSIPRGSMVQQPRKYLLAVAPLPPADAAERVEKAALIAHLPDHAVFWVEGTRTRSMGRTRYFQSPPLLLDQKYTYRVSAAWIEDGRWVGQTRMVPVQAGLIQAIYLRPIPVIPAQSAMRSLPK